MKTNNASMADPEHFSRMPRHTAQRLQAAPDEREVPIQIVAPEALRRQVTRMGVDEGENIRTVVLRGLRAIGIDIAESELTDRPGRRWGNGDGSK